MLRSFKLKMALYAVCTSGVILVAFGGLFMSVIRRAGLQRIDRHLHALADGQLRRPAPEASWPRLDESLASFYGESNRRSFLIKVLGRDGAAIYTSARWPKALEAAALAPPAEALPPFIEQPDLARPPRPFRPGDEPPPFRWRTTRPLFRTLSADGQEWRFVSMRSPQATLLLGTDLAGLRAEQQRFWAAFAVSVPVGLILLAAGGWLLAGQALRPVKVLARVAGGMTAQGLDRRVQAPGADREFQALIDVINGMLDRLEKSFGQAARFSADAAHELKTPLTILQGQLNQALQSAPSGSDEQRTYADLLEEVQHLKSIIRKLLLLAQSDAGQLRLSLERVSLNDAVDALLEDASLLAPGLTLHKELAPGLCVMADPDLLRHVLQNLFSNAVKYNCDHGVIECRLRRDQDTVTLSLANTTGPDVRIDRDRLFDRFYRGDPSRSRRVDGSGLGLSLAREIARAHNGDLAVDAAETREGWLAFRLRLPATGC